MHISNNSKIAVALKAIRSSVPTVVEACVGRRKRYMIAGEEGQRKYRKHSRPHRFDEANVRGDEVRVSQMKLLVKKDDNVSGSKQKRKIYIVSYVLYLHPSSVVLAL